MTVILGSARIDENGNARNGKAGDQTSKEVSTQKWYKHSKGWRVFRCKNSARAEKIADDMQYACNNPHIGYDQNERITLYNIAKNYNFDCSKVNKNCETDCSALVRVCCAYAGIILPNFTTSDEGKILLASGYFDELTGAKYSNSSVYLKRGDILVTKTKGHTVIVLSNGIKATDKSNNGDKVLVTGKTVWIRKKPDKLSIAVGLAYMGDTFPYLGTIDLWNKINFENEECYITKKYTEII